MLDYSPASTGDHFEDIAATAPQQLLGELPEQVARLHRDADSLARYRSTRLTETVGFAAEHSPWQADRLSGLHLDYLPHGFSSVGGGAANHQSSHQRAMYQAHQAQHRNRDAQHTFNEQHRATQRRHEQAIADNRRRAEQDEARRFTSRRRARKRLSRQSRVQLTLPAGTPIHGDRHRRAGGTDLNGCKPIIRLIDDRA